MSRAALLVALTLTLGAALSGCKRGADRRGDTSDMAVRDTGTAMPDLGSDVGSDDGGEGSRYRQGDQLCCARGEGTACCPGGVASSTCAPYGGIYHHCIAAGEMYEGKVSCAHCCQGLVRAGLTEPTDASGTDIVDGCGPSAAPDSLLVCIRCGDGVCGAGENRCRCPEDCR